METRFEIGDVVHWEGVGEYTVTSLDFTGFPGHVMLACRYAVETSQLRLVRRASAQREGGDEPPQPAPMTRAARVLAKMERDPYEQARNKVEARIGLDTQNHLDHYTATATDNEPKQQAARLRMAKISLDRPLDAERARWERLVLAKVPVGRR